MVGEPMIVIRSLTVNPSQNMMDVKTPSMNLQRPMLLNYEVEDLTGNIYFVSGTSDGRYHDETSSLGTAHR